MLTKATGCRTARSSSSPLRGPVTGIVLAGGKSERMGRNKAFLELDGRPLIEIVLERVSAVCSEVMIVTTEPGPFAGLGALLVEDQLSGLGVLGGLHAGLSASTHDLALVVGCDMPFLNSELLLAFVEWAHGADVATLRQGEQVEPLHAAYRKTCIPAIEAAARKNRRRVISFFPDVRVRYVTYEEVRPFDPDLLSFRNVNTPEEWETTRTIWRGQHPRRVL
ncbi:MAG: molybdenum cofactor guanylyltransferase [Actinobacteria bacterium]|nr:molybdenum cofactor guanylyltransferase [Actinomycetota bacterium]